MFHFIYSLPILTSSSKRLQFYRYSFSLSIGTVVAGTAGAAVVAGVSIAFHLPTFKFGHGTVVTRTVVRATLSMGFYALQTALIRHALLDTP